MKFNSFIIQYLGQRGPSTQSTMHDIDRSGVIFYAQISRSGIGCWNSNKPLTPQNFHFLTGNNRTMIYPSDLTVSEKTINFFVCEHQIECFPFRSIVMDMYGCTRMSCQGGFILKSTGTITTSDFGVET